jgi:hypothetical protein
MKKMTKNCGWVWVWGWESMIGLMFLLFNFCYAQDTTRVIADTLKQQDSVKVVQDTTKIAPKKVNVEKASGEVELTEITIEAVVEKPRVALMPKRLEPELGEMEVLDRSFENELKKGPDKPLLIDDGANVPSKIKKVQKKLK